MRGSQAPATLSVALDARYVQSHFPGIGRYTYNLAEALAALPDGPRLSLIHNPHLPDSRYHLSGLAQRYPERVRLVPTAAEPFSPGEQWRLFGPARRAGYHLWHAPYYIRPYVLPVPVVLTAHDAIGSRIPDTFPSRKTRLAFELTTRLAFATSRRVIAVSNSAAQDIQHFYKVRPGKIAVVPHGVTGDFHPLSPEEQTLARSRLKLPERYLLYVGINKPHKNLARLLEAFAVYRRQGGDPELMLVLAGREDPRYTSGLNELAARLGLQEQVSFRGEVAEAELPALYACATLFVFPSLLEGFGFPVLEAMACGAAVASADNSALPEVTGEAAILFDATSVPAIAAALAQGLQDREALRRKSIERAARFSWQHTARRTLEVYRQVARNNNRN